MCPLRNRWRNEREVLIRDSISKIPVSHFVNVITILLDVQNSSSWWPYMTKMKNHSVALFMELSRFKNIAHLCKRDGWGRKVGVAYIVSVGRGKLDLRTLSVITAMGAYQEGVRMWVKGYCEKWLFTLETRKSGRHSSYRWLFHAEYVDSPPFFPTLYTYHPLNKSPSIPTWKSKELKRQSSLFKSSSISKKKKSEKKSTSLDGSSSLSVPFSNQTFVFSCMRVLCQVQRVSIIYGNLLISTRMLEVLVERLWPWKRNTDRIFSVLWLLNRILSVRCRTSLINICTSLFLQVGSWGAD